MAISLVAEARDQYEVLCGSGTIDAEISRGALYQSVNLFYFTLAVARLILTCTRVRGVQVKFLSRLLKLEFIYKPDTVFETNFTETVESMQRRGERCWLGLIWLYRVSSCVPVPVHALDNDQFDTL